MPDWLRITPTDMEWLAGTVISGFGHRPPTLFNEKGEQVLPFTNPENIQYYLIEQVVQTLLDKGSCVSMGASAANTNRVMEMILGRK